MNERIKELAVQAGIGIWGDSYVNHFATLIIQECINQAVQTKNTKEAIKAELDYAGKLEMKSENAAIEIAVQRIKQHFGVKQMTDKEPKPVAWMYTNAQGKEVIVKADVPPYDDAVPLFKSEPQPGLCDGCGIALTR